MSTIPGSATPGVPPADALPVPGTAFGGPFVPSPAAGGTRDALVRAGRGLAVGAELRAELDALYADYAAALDDRRYDDWIELFVDDCRYLLQPRENFERGLPLATLAFESKGMLRDRVYGVTRTLFHAPYTQRHLVGPLRVTALGADGAVDVQASYAVYRTKVQDRTEVFNVGQYLDRVVREPDGRMRFAVKRAIFDSETIPNSIIHPI